MNNHYSHGTYDGLKNAAPNKSITENCQGLNFQNDGRGRAGAQMPLRGIQTDSAKNYLEPGFPAKMSKTVIEEFDLVDEIDELKKVTVYVAEQVFTDGHKTYLLYFYSTELEFDCQTCFTTDYSLCMCDKNNWGCNFIRSNKILSCEDKDTLLEIYHEIVDNIHLLKKLTREPFIDWIYEKTNEIENVYIEIDF